MARPVEERRRKGRVCPPRNVGFCTADRLVSMLRPMALLSTEQESLLREIEPALETYYDPHLKDASRKSAIGMWWYMMGERCLVAI